jgi:hypothetical protein
MGEKKGKSIRRNRVRTFEAEAKNLFSMRLIAAPRPEDDLSDEQLIAVIKKSNFSPETIHHLIERIKMI